MSESEMLFLKTLQGNATEQDGIPFWFMRQAGRYLPEYRELRAEKGGFLAMAFDPEAACEITMQPVRRFGMDAAIIFSDILTIPMSLGQHLEFVTGEGPKLGALNLDELEFDGEVLQPVYQALRETRSQLNHEGFGQTTLIGFSGAPWTVATYMVEGGSSRDFLKVKTMAYREPEEFKKLMDMLVKATARYLILQVEAGAQALQIFDSWAGALDQFGFERWCIQPIKLIVDLVRAVYPNIPIIGFPKGAGLMYERFIKETGVDAIQIDPLVPSEYAADVLQKKVPVQGNLDPLCLLAGGDVLTSNLTKILDDLSGGDYIFNLGHGIHKETPIAHVEQMVKIIRDYR